MHHRSISDDADVAALSHNPSLAERNGEIFAGIKRPVIRLAVKMLMLEKQHRIVGADGGAQQAANIERGRRHHDAEARNVRESYLTALTVVNRATGEVAADSHANYDWAFECAGRSPPDRGEFVTELHHRGPNVVEELDFGDGLKAAQRHSYRPPDAGNLSQRCIEDAIRTKTPLKACCRLEDAAFTLYFREAVLAAYIRYVLAEYENPLVHGDFVGEGGGNHVHHRLRSPVKARLGFKRFRRGVDVRGVHI